MQKPDFMAKSGFCAGNETGALEVVLLFGPGSQLVTELRMRDTNQVETALTNRLAIQLGDAVLCHDVMDLSLIHISEPTRPY